MTRVFKRFHAFLTAAVLCIAASPALSQEGDSTSLAPPSNLTAVDTPWDGGDHADLTWSLSPDDVALTEAQTEARATPRVSHYEIFKASEHNGIYRSAGTAVPHEWDYLDREMTFSLEKLERGEPYLFKVRAVGSDGSTSPMIATDTAVMPTRQIFDGSRFWLAILTFALCGAVIYWINYARLGKPLKVRKIAGLEAVDEAVGRATEMGRSVLFIPGIQDMNDIQTIAGITILARVAKTAAEYDAKVEVPTSRALVMTTARETVQASFLSAGRPDAYNEDMIYYVTDEQFGYVAYLQGMMVREKPAACFYMGSFFAESLILAETGNSIGAIQVAGTAQPAQLPFFVAACDYTLIGEEFFAASAYLSGSPEELGSLKGQDVGKLIVAVLLLIGVFLFTWAELKEGTPMGLKLAEAVTFLRNTILN